MGAAAKGLDQKQIQGKKANSISEIKKQWHRWKGTEVEISIDGKSVYQGPCFSVSVHLGQAHGQGFAHAPQAIPDDGLFEINLIPTLSAFEKYTKWAALRNGNILEEPSVKKWQGEQIEVFGPNALPLALDEVYAGETPARMDCLYQRLRIISMLKNMQP